MKILRVLLIAILISLVGYPVYSQEPLVLYDDFRGESIDLNKWEKQSVSYGILDVKRFIKWNRLHLMERSHGDIKEDSFLGHIFTKIRLQFKNEFVTAIQAKLKVKHFEAVGCTSNENWPHSIVRAGRLSGSFFNTGEGGEGAENDVFAAIEIIGDSDSLDPDGMLRVRGVVIKCEDQECINGTDLDGSPVDLGTIMVGPWQWTKLLIQWEPEYSEDGATGAFIFQHDNGPEVILPYYFEHEIDALDPSKRIGISSFVPNCADEPRPVGYADVVIKNVFVNASALEE